MSGSGQEPSNLKRYHYRRGYRPSALIVTLDSHPIPSKFSDFILIYSLSELGTITELNCFGLFCLLLLYSSDTYYKTF